MDKKDDVYKAQLALEVENIRSKYLPQDQNKLEQNKLEQLKKLDKQATIPGKKSVFIMIFISLLLLVTGFFVIIFFKLIFAGIICCAFSLICAFLIKPIYNLITEKERTRLTPQIMRLSNEILGNKSQNKQRN
ncbi:MAG: hypothetical protein GX297_02655 [Treponema sp.]|nr:hypothetical protein [Treponema sp.]